MALSLLAGYSSPDESGSDSDDGIDVVIHKNVGMSTQARKNTTQTEGARKRPSQHHRPASTAKMRRNHPSSNTASSSSSKPESVLNNPHVFCAGGEEGLDGASIPLPSTVLTMFDKEEEATVDQPFMHKGRIRSFPHEKNNWASFVYIDASDIDLEEVREFLVKELQLEPAEDFHISLSRTVSLRHHWIDPLISSLTLMLKEMDRFTLKLDKLNVYTNDDRTRTFVGLEATGGRKQLNKISQGVDKILKEYNLPPFYYPPSYHVSLGWCVGDRQSEISKLLPGVEMKLVDVLEDDEDFGKVFVKTVTCKSGNKFFDFQLK